MPNSPVKYRSKGEHPAPSSDPVSPSSKKESPVKTEVRVCEDHKEKLGGSSVQTSFSQDSEKKKDPESDSAPASKPKIYSEVYDLQLIKDPGIRMSMQKVGVKLSDIDKCLNKLQDIRNRVRKAIAKSKASEPNPDSTSESDSAKMESYEFDSDMDDESSSETSSDTDDITAEPSTGPAATSEQEVSTLAYTKMREVVQTLSVEDQRELRDSVNFFKELEAKNLADPTIRSPPNMKTVISVFEYALQ